MKRHAQIVGLLLTVFVLGALVQQEPDTEMHAEPESADVQQPAYEPQVLVQQGRREFSPARQGSRRRVIAHEHWCTDSG